MARLDPVDPAQVGELKDAFAASERAVGFITNNLKIMAHKPDITNALMGLFSAVMMAPGEVSKDLKFLIAYVASFSSGCMYCSAHTGLNANKLGMADEKLQAIWQYETSALFSEAERAALRVAQLAGQVPNGVDDEHFEDLKKHYNPAQIVEIVAAISLYGFFNRFNDTFATPLETPTQDKAADTLGSTGWRPGRHEV
jgi:uncharacterized peroxidase-related enzyme